MLPTGRGPGPSHPNDGRPISEKEEIARAALRSLAEPQSAASSSLTPIPPPPPPHPQATAAAAAPSQQPPPSLFTPPFTSERSVPERPLAQRSRHSMDHDARPMAPSRSASLMDLDPPSRRYTEMTTTSSSSSFFGDQCLTASPTSSPRLDSRSALPRSERPPSPPRQQSLGMSFSSSISSSSTSFDLYDLALRRTSVALRIDLEEVRQIVERVYPHKIVGLTRSMSANMNPRSVPVETMDPDFVRRVLDAFHHEEDRIQHAYRPQDPSMTYHRDTRGLDLRPPLPAGQVWADSQHQPQRYLYRERGSQAYPRRSIDDWNYRSGARSDERPFDHRQETHFMGRNSASQAIAPVPASAAAASGGPSSQGQGHPSSSSLPTPRGESPSPFAFDPHRRPSQPVRLEMSPPEHSAFSSRASFESFDEHHRRRYMSTENQSGMWPETSASRRYPSASIDDRRVRSIDDYLNQTSGPAMASTLNRAAAPHAAPPDSDGLADRYKISRHAYQPYPVPARSSNADGKAPHSSKPLESPQMSPTALEASPRHSFGQRRSPLLKSPAAAASSSTISSMASTSGLTPSPMLGGSAGVSDEPMRSPGSVDPPSGSRGWSEDPNSETTRESVASMQIDELESPRPSIGPTRTSRSSSRVDRTSTTPAGTDLTHSEIMQKLQEKVKSRLAAKGRGENPDAIRGSGRGKSTRGSISRRSQSNANTLGASLKAASSSSKLTSTSPAPAPSPISGGGGTILERAKRSTSTASSSNSKLSPSSASPAVSPSTVSPKPQRTETPSSIAAALLSPTDTPTPTEHAAAQQAKVQESEEVPTVETASGQVLPGDLPGAGQMNASSANKQQNSMAGIDSLLQAAAKSDPTETNSAIA